MSLTPRILIIGPDESLQAHVEAALAPIEDVRATLHSSPDYRKGVEAARDRQPHLILVELNQQLEAVRAAIEELCLRCPHSAVVAVFHPSLFSAGPSEGQVLIDLLRAGARDFLRLPLSSADLDQFIDRHFRKPLQAPPATGKVVTFFTNKGGVGKSTLSLSTSCLLAKRFPNRVLLIDGSIQMGICATMLDLRPTTTLTSVVRERARLDETLLRELTVRHSCGLHLLAAPFNALEASLIDDELFSRVMNLARRTFDYIVVDTFPMIDRVMISVLDIAECAYLVTESTVPILEGTARMLKVLDELGVPAARRRIVLNRYSSYIGNLPPEEVTKRMGFNIDFVVPYEKKLLVAANTGSPLVLQQALFSRFHRAIDKIVDDIATRRSVLPVPDEPTLRPASLNLPTQGVPRP